MSHNRRSRKVAEFPIRILAISALVAMLGGCGGNTQRKSSEQTSEQTSTTTSVSSQQDSAPAPSDSLRTTASAPETEDSTTWKTYDNSRYGFSFKYPPNLRPAGFEVFHHMGRRWRAMATDSSGEGVVAVPIVRIDGRKAYPRFYGVDLRVGVSRAPHAYDASNGEKYIGSITINGVPFKQYEMSDAAMMQYVGGISYRAERNGVCYAIEQLRTGSNYRDSASTADMPQNELDRYYYLAGKIVKTFRFH